MKVMIAYPPLDHSGKVPLLSQNRRFQWFMKPTYNYPVVPATAATLLSRNGHDVVWADGIAAEWSYEQWLDTVRREKPDVIAMETKTPVIKQHWRIIDDIRKQSCEDGHPQRHPLTVLMGDHVTALPEESMKDSRVDFVLTGGDYDFLLLDLCKQLSAGGDFPPPGVEPGIYYRKDGEVRNTGKFDTGHELDGLPFIDRDLTQWQLYAYKNGNYRRRPGTYIMAGRDCWWGKCTFCSWAQMYPRFRVRSPENVLDEIGVLIDRYRVKEVMDDTGTFPTGQWLEEFCMGMISRGYNRQVKIDCNMRSGRLSEEDYRLMSRAGFRMILYGLESADQAVLDHVNKGTRVPDMAEDCRLAKKSGLTPHLSTMVGYPWETRQSAETTVEFLRDLFRKGWIDSMQASVLIPYPGTPLFEECRKNGWLQTEDWERYDMAEPVVRCEIPAEEIIAMTQELYRSFMTPRFILRKLASARSVEDVRFLGRQACSILSRLHEFPRR